jgi:CelD/BcsL family acetyltransferase involved in cellulose biosynthesis
MCSVIRNEVLFNLSTTAAPHVAPSGAVKHTAPIRVSIIEDLATLAGMESEWNVLVERTTNEPFYRHEYIRSWIENFTPEAPLKLLTGRDPGGRLVALLPLVEERVSFCGIPIRQWTSPTNVHSYRFDLLAEQAGAAAGAFLKQLQLEKGWDLLKMTDIPPDGKAWQFYAQAQSARFPVGVYEAQRSTYIALPGTFEALQTDLGGKFRGNLRRRRKTLESKGKVSVERITGGPSLQARLEECFVIEQSGWKGKRGEPANLDPRIHGFYSALARRASEQGSFSLFQLKLDERPIAFHYGLTQNGIYSLVMTSYDESLRDCGPGHLLVEEVLKVCVEEGIHEFDFLGCDLEWKRAWSRTSRQHSWLYIFRDSVRGQLLQRVKFRWVPAAKRLLGNLRKAGPMNVQTDSPKEG